MSRRLLRRRWTTPRHRPRNRGRRRSSGHGRVTGGDGRRPGMDGGLDLQELAKPARLLRGIRSQGSGQDQGRRAGTQHRMDHGGHVGEPGPASRMRGQRDLPAGEPGGCGTSGQSGGVCPAHGQESGQGGIGRGGQEGGLRLRCPHQCRPAPLSGAWSRAPQHSAQAAGDHQG